MPVVLIQRLSFNRSRKSSRFSQILTSSPVSLIVSFSPVALYPLGLQRLDVILGVSQAVEDFTGVLPKPGYRLVDPVSGRADGPQPRRTIA